MLYENDLRIELEYRRTAFRLLSIFNPFIQQSCCLKKVQYLDRDVFSHLVAYNDPQVPKSYCRQGLTITKNVWGCFRYVLASIALGNVYLPQFK